ncbi:MAG TPA: hypothetical protein HPQ03_03435 [Deltaproteobacteria bacterium]|nr:hypothetical protein [Deltaproteobacteria bacterium]
MKPRTYITIFIGVCFNATTGTPSFISIHEPTTFVLDKTAQHDVLFLGTTHQQPRMLNFISKLIPRLHESGITHIGLEISSDQQENIDRFMNTGTGLSDIRLFAGIDCPEYRQVIEIVRKNRLTPVAMDSPKSMWGGSLTRDQWMAMRIAETFQKNEKAKLFVIVGNLHTLKRVKWAVPAIKDQFIRYHLSLITPRLCLYSVAGSINDSPETCDFQKWFGGASTPIGIETRSFDRKLGLTRTISAKPMTAHEAVDAVIVF